MCFSFNKLLSKPVDSASHNGGVGKNPFVVTGVQIISDSTAALIVFAARTASRESARRKQIWMVKFIV